MSDGKVDKIAKGIKTCVTKICIMFNMFNDNKRLISYDGITTYPYGIEARILCKQELLSKVLRKC